jgi:hypothetical protein
MSIFERLKRPIGVERDSLRGVQVNRKTGKRDVNYSEKKMFSEDLCYPI